ncbi:MAG: hypothetical protein WC141_09285 [Arcobacteraceae bacterium]
MIKIIKTVVALSISINLSLSASTLKENEFDLQKIGATFETFVLQTDKKFQQYEQKIQALNQEILNLKNLKKETKNHEVQNIEIINTEVQSDEIKDLPTSLTNEPYVKDIRTVNTQKGIIAYSEPFSIDDLYVTRYDYGINLEIDKCNEYGWCKIMDKNEYVAEYLLIRYENN